MKPKLSERQAEVLRKMRDGEELLLWFPHINEFRLSSPSRCERLHARTGRAVLERYCGAPVGAKAGEFISFGMSNAGRAALAEHERKER